MRHYIYSAILLSGLAGIATPAHAQSGEEFLGQITPVANTCCPRGTAEANGQLLPIASNTALFSLYGTIYGGDGRTTFALPNLQSAIPIHTGSGPGLTNRPQGSRGGAETTTATTLNLPNHTHRAAIKTVNSPPNSPTPFASAFTTNGGNVYVSGENPGEVGSTTKSPRLMNPNTMYVEPTGGGQAMNNMMPTLTIRYCVFTQGIYPSRS